MLRDTLFRIASMTKPVTVAAAMSLVDENKLALRDPIVRWLPEFADVRVLDDPSGSLDRTHPVQRAILVEDLLAHTSGLAYGFLGGRTELPGLRPSAVRARSRRLAGRPRPSCRWCISRASG